MPCSAAVITTVPLWQNLQHISPPSNSVTRHAESDSGGPHAGHQPAPSLKTQTRATTNKGRSREFAPYFSSHARKKRRKNFYPRRSSRQRRHTPSTIHPPPPPRGGRRGGLGHLQYDQVAELVEKTARQLPQGVGREVPSIFFDDERERERDPGAGRE